MIGRARLASVFAHISLWALWLAGLILGGRNCARIFANEQIRSQRQLISAMRQEAERRESLQ